MLDSTYDEVFEFEATHWWYVGRRAIIKKNMEFIISKTMNAQGLQKRTILDFGCGTGFMTNILEQFGKVKGFDSSPKSIELSRKRGIKNTFLCTDLKGFSQSEEPFDVVTLFDVLEHVQEEEELLNCLRKLTKTNGYILVTVPAYQWLWSGEDYVSQHLRRYTKTGLIKVLEKSNFKVERATYFNFWLLPFQIFTILSYRIFKKKKLKKSNIRIHSKLLNRILTFIFRSEAFFLRLFRFPAGGSILCIAKPRN
jgi:2-polyprenyl-3-methyl-5-hydroxy-6-metoxy-1,4-benzoquinol methylase